MQATFQLVKAGHDCVNVKQIAQSARLGDFKNAQECADQCRAIQAQQRTVPFNNTGYAVFSHLVKWTGAQHVSWSKPGFLKKTSGGHNWNGGAVSTLCVKKAVNLCIKWGNFLWFCTCTMASPRVPWGVNAAKRTSLD